MDSSDSTDPTADFSQRFERHSQQRPPIKIVDHKDKAIDKRPAYILIFAEVQSATFIKHRKGVQNGFRTVLGIILIVDTLKITSHANK